MLEVGDKFLIGWVFVEVLFVVLDKLRNLLNQLLLSHGTLVSRLMFGS